MLNMFLKHLSKAKKMAHKKYKYEGKKTISSIRLTDEERVLILSRFESIQEFVQKSIEKLKRGKK